jgi:hypothetical protein
VRLRAVDRVDYSELWLTCVRPQSTQRVPPEGRQLLPSSPHITIHDLPLETIERVINIAHSALSLDARERKERRHFLLATSLVCREWTSLSQRALWIDVEVDIRSIKSFAAAGSGRHFVRRLVVAAKGLANARYVEWVLNEVRGVRDLKMKEVSIRAEWLCGPDWRGTPPHQRGTHIPDIVARRPQDARPLASV